MASTDQKTVYHWPAGDGRVCIGPGEAPWEQLPVLDGAYWVRCRVCRELGVVVTDQGRILDFMPPGTRLSEDGKTLILEFRDPPLALPSGWCSDG